MNENTDGVPERKEAGGVSHRYRRSSVTEVLAEFGYPADGEHTVDDLDGRDGGPRLYQDGCPGSTPPEDRPGFQQLLADVRSGEFPVNSILVEDWTRISRDPVIVRQMEALAEAAGAPIRYARNSAHQYIDTISKLVKGANDV